MKWKNIGEQAKIFLKNSSNVDNHKVNDHYTCVEAHFLPEAGTNVRIWKRRGVRWMPTDEEMLKLTQEIITISPTFREQLLDMLSQNVENQKTKVIANG